MLFPIATAVRMPVQGQPELANRSLVQWLAFTIVPLWRPSVLWDFHPVLALLVVNVGLSVRLCGIGGLKTISSEK